MQVIIDNHDGLGPVDYTSLVQFGESASITRVLNRPTLCVLPIITGIGGAATPVYLARVEVLTRESGCIFTGYVASSPASNAVGVGPLTPIYVAEVVAVSDELLLDFGVSDVETTLLRQDPASDWASLGALSSTASLPISVSEELTTSSRLPVGRGTRWSTNAEALANSTRSAYRAVNSSLQVTTFGEIVHPVQPDDPGLHFQSIDAEDLRWLASDVTVLGHEEPTAYLTEVFEGDGSTATFTLSEKPFMPAAKQRSTILDLFQGQSLNERLWTVHDPEGCLALTANGLTCSGGTGRDGQTTVVSVQQVELGGTLVFSLEGVEIAPGSAGVLVGLYPTTIDVLNCFAGFEISSATGSQSLTALINGVASGSAFTPQLGRSYTLRLRVCSEEMERIRQSYTFQTGTVLGSTGGQVVASEGTLVFEVQDVTSGTPAAPVTLLSASVRNMPPACLLGVLNSGSLTCSIRSVKCTQSGPMRVGVAMPGSTPADVSVDSEVNGGSCKVTSSGNVVFYPNVVPATSSLIYVHYRARGLSAARRMNDPTLEPAGSSLATSAWVGTVTSPVAWSSVDCDSAASAILQTARSSSVALKGTYVTTSMQLQTDVWPGDALLAGALAGLTPTDLIVRKTDIRLLSGVPELVKYEIAFANDWAESVCIKVANTGSQDTVAPLQPNVLANALQSLSTLTVTSISGSVLALNTGVSAPVNGGFEVRRRDDVFGPGVNADLVLRTSTSAISIPRAAAVEQYFIRMYDGNNPPNYSVMSAGIILNVSIS